MLSQKIWEHSLSKFLKIFLKHKNKQAFDTFILKIQVLGGVFKIN
jgi:hypothetical protein